MLIFAPSTTKDMDINDLRVALFNYIVAKQNNKNLIIKIEDINIKEEINKKVKDILNLLNLFSIEYTQLLYQSNNIKYYQQIAMQMLIDKKAFNCFCSDEALQKDKEELNSYSGFCENLKDETILSCEAPFRIRIKKPKDEITFFDLLKGKCVYKPLEIDSFIILNQNKTPTFDFATAIDDMLNNITTIIRDDKYLKNTAKQIYIRESIGYKAPIEYIHLPKIKTDKELNIQTLIDEGFLPAAIINYLILCSYDTPKEIFSIKDVIKWFDIKKIKKNLVKFDLDKLKEINQIYQSQGEIIV